MVARIVGVFCTALAIAPLAAGAQSGYFLVRLGDDTVAVERYQRSATRIEGSVVRRLPQTVIVRYIITFNADGTVSSFVQNAMRADGTPAQTPAAGTMTFTADSVVRQTTQNGQPVTLRTVAPKGTLPGLGMSWLVYQLQLEAAKRDGSANVIGFAAQQQAPGKADIRFIGTDSAEIVAGGFRTGFKLGRDGRIVRGDGSLTTQKFIVTPVADIDIAALAKAWEAKDVAGSGLGTASPRDSLKASVGSAQILIDYGRPAKRGREVWGKLVPYDTTWRFGANAATQFRTDKDLVIGGVAVPAGFYTLWLYPTAGSAWLIVNSQTGQWGTAYDSTKNVARIPLERHMSLPNTEERFRIFLVGDMLMMHWDRGGYGVRIREK